MCDFDKISRLIIGAQLAYLAGLALVAAAVILGLNPFTSGANIPAMVIASASAATDQATTARRRPSWCSACSSSW